MSRKARTTRAGAARTRSAPKATRSRSAPSARSGATASRPPGRADTRRAPERKLQPYYAKRHFDKTPEPTGARKAPKAATRPRFVVQKHDATQLHYDFRLEEGGVLKSWAVPKGPSLNPADKRLAVRTEDHPLDYIDFEGVIPEGEYGGGPVIVWDQGTYRNVKVDRGGTPLSMEESLKKGTVEVELRGKKLRGIFALVRTRPAPDGRENWILFKIKDDYADSDRSLIDELPRSVKSGRTIEEVVVKEGTPDQARKKLARARKRAEEQGKPPPKLKLPQVASGAAKKRRSVPAAEPPTPSRGRDPFPEWVQPMLATLVDAPPKPSRTAPWLYEPKLDGFRALAFKDGDRVRLLSRNRKDFGTRFPEIADAVSRQPLRRFIIDGEIVALDAKGDPSFSLLQQRLRPITLAAARRSDVPLFYYVFDLLYFGDHKGGHDTRALEQHHRSALVREALSFDDPLRETPQIEGDGPALLNAACKRGLEGLIAKQSDCPYLSGRAMHWIKLKCLLAQEFVIGGWTDPEGSREAFGSLLVGYYDRGKLIYAGKVGTGYSDATLRELSRAMKPLATRTLAFEKDPSIPRKGVHPIEPRLVAHIPFTEWTHDGHIRHPRFAGLRPDKDARTVVKETPSHLTEDR